MNILEKILNLFKAKSSKYWDSRYTQGGNSGAGSYGLLADFKRKVLEDFFLKNEIKNVIEFGSGDGNQLSLFTIKLNYIGLDISQQAINLCKSKFQNDDTKSFHVFSGEKGYCKKNGFSATLTMSLDVIYHLVEDKIYESYLSELFNSSEKYVVIYSSNNENIKDTSWHVKHREFTKDVVKWFPDFELISKVENEYPVGNQSGVESSADFYFYQRKS